MKKWGAVAVSVLTGFYATPLRASVETGAEEILFSDIPVVVEVASLFKEIELQASSTVEQITEKDWTLRGDRNIYEAMSHGPSTKIVRSHTGYLMFTRGYTSQVGSRGYAMTLDGVPMSGYAFQSALYGMPDFPLGLLERIETIRGPGSSLYGSDAFHGVIALKTPDPLEDFVSIKAHGGSDSFAGGTGTFSRAVGAWRVTGGYSYDHMGDQETPVKAVSYRNPPWPNLGLIPRPDQTVSESHFGQAGLLKARSDPSKPVVFDTAFYGNAYNGGCEPYSLMPQGQPCRQVQNRRQTVKAGLTFHLPARTTLETVGYHWNGTFNWINPSGMYGWTGFVPPFTPFSYGADLRIRERRRGLKATLKQENLLNTQWALGYEYSFQDVPTTLEALHDPATGQHVRDWHLYNDQTPTNYRREVESGFLTAKTSLFDRAVSLIYGGRFDYYTDFGGHFSPRAGLIVQPTPNDAVKLLYGNAFRAPSSAEQHGNNFDVVEGDRNLAPETINTYELIFMHEGSKWKGSLTGFYSKWENALSFRPVPFAQSKSIGNSFRMLNKYANLGEFESRGLEATGGVHLGPVDLDMSGSYVHAYNITSQIDQRSFPMWIANADVTYNLPERRLKATLSNRVMLHQDTTNTSNVRMKDYHRMDLNLTKGLGQNWNASADVRNVLGRSNERPLDGATNITQIREETTQYWMSIHYFLGRNGVLWQ